jgi:6-phosphogluconolactonase/glucosamine-6-phosphate isomerase/deaminase
LPSVQEWVSDAAQNIEWDQYSIAFIKRRGGDGKKGARLMLNVTDSDVALTGAYQGRRRMTLTYPIINSARRVLWLVTGSEKAGMLTRLRMSDSSIPAGRVEQDRTLLFADRAAVADMSSM